MTGTHCTVLLIHSLFLCYLGVDVSSMHAMKTQRPSTMLSDVRQLVATGVNLSQPNDDGVTLVSEVAGLTFFFLPSINSLLPLFSSVSTRFCSSLFLLP